MRILLIAAFAVLIFSCKKTITPESPGNIINESFTELLEIDGHEYDSIVIENCVFENGGLYWRCRPHHNS